MNPREDGLRSPAFHRVQPLATARCLSDEHHCPAAPKGSVPLRSGTACVQPLQHPYGPGGRRKPPLLHLAHPTAAPSTVTSVLSSAQQSPTKPENWGVEGAVALRGVLRGEAHEIQPGASQRKNQRALWKGNQKQRNNALGRNFQSRQRKNRTGGAKKLSDESRRGRLAIKRSHRLASPEMNSPAQQPRRVACR